MIIVCGFSIEMAIIGNRATIGGIFQFYEMRKNFWNKKTANSE